MIAIMLAVKDIHPTTYGFTTDPVIRNTLLLTFAFWLTSTVALVVLFTRLPPVLPLFYSLIQGEKQLANRPFISLLPIISFIFIALHVWFANLSFHHDRIFARLLTATAALLSFLFSVALTHIIIIVL